MKQQIMNKSNDYTIEELELIMRYLDNFRSLNYGKPERNSLKAFASHLVVDYESQVNKFISKENKKNTKK